MDITSLTLIIFSFLVVFVIFYTKNFIAKKLKIFDYPDKIRKIHKKRTPLVGGFPIVIFLLSVIFINLDSFYVSKDFILLVIGSIFIFVIGLIDDRIGLTPYKKIWFLCLIIFFTIKFSDQIFINYIYIKSINSFYALTEFSTFLTIFSLLVLINAFNLSDGINGLNLGQSFFWILHFLINFEFDYTERTILYTLLFIIFLSFIINFKGYFFLGDNGSFLISSFVGFFLILTLNKYWSSNFPEKIWPINISWGIEHTFLLFYLPGLDMLRLFIERILNKKNPMLPDKNHLHHYLFFLYGNKLAILFYLLLLNFPLLLIYFLKNKQILLILSAALVIYPLVIYYLKKK